MRTLRAIFYLLPDLAGILLAALSLAVIFMSEAIQKLEKPNLKWLRWTLATIFIFVGVGGVISNSMQKSEDKAKAEGDRQTLIGQVGQLISASQIQATSDDIHKLGAQITDGFAAVIAAIKGVKAPPKTVQQLSVSPQLPPALVQKLTVTQRRAPSSNPSLPYALQVIIQTNINIQPLGFEFVCDGPVGGIDFFIAGQIVYQMKETGVKGNIAYFKLGYPPLRPETPLVVTLLSKENIRVVEIRQLN